MKQFARKPRSLSLVPPAAEKTDPAQETGDSSLKDFFDGWLNSVDPTTLRTGRLLEKRASETSLGQPPLTSTDLTRVNRATVRESTDHRHWPSDVVEKFLVADIIKRKGK